MSDDSAITEANVTAVVNNIFALFNKHGLAHVPRKDAMKFVEILSDIAVDIVTRDDEIAKLREQLTGMIVWEPTRKCVKPEAAVADAFWKYWRENGETHVHGYYESTWGAINAAINAQSIDPAPQQEHAGGRDAASEFGNTLAGKK